METKEKVLELIWERRKQIISARTPKVILNVTIIFIVIQGFINGVPAYVGRYYNLLFWIITFGFLFLFYSLGLSGLLFWKTRKRGRIKKKWKQVIKLMLILFDDLALLYLTAILLISGILYPKFEFGSLDGLFISIISFVLIFIIFVAVRKSPGMLGKEAEPNIEQEINLRNISIQFVIPLSLILSVFVRGYYAFRRNDLDGDIDIAFLIYAFLSLLGGLFLLFYTVYQIYRDGLLIAKGFHKK